MLINSPVGTPMPMAIRPSRSVLTKPRSKAGRADHRTSALKKVSIRDIFVLDWLGTGPIRNVPALGRHGVTLQKEALRPWACWPR